MSRNEDPRVLSAEQQQDRVTEVRKASQAREVLESEAVARALESMETNLQRSFRETPLRDEAGLLKIRMMYDVLETFKQHLQDEMDSGEMAAAQLLHHEQATGETVR